MLQVIVQCREIEAVAGLFSCDTAPPTNSDKFHLFRVDRPDSQTQKETQRAIPILIRGSDTVNLTSLIIDAYGPYNGDHTLAQRATLPEEGKRMI